ncbi:DUF3857 and transglutaminase domain-containing protein [Flavobacterium sediminilitoris]|uniref:DUF3857 and transglutaminase domain-containing protein n=1 Tax=Flavobacterium sediminilitoris TaxID=2024526 RepID=A0ABY4HSR3_9FLAO|nr:MULTISPECIES: DUF3857 domain-containing protein [Flavobacterium]UOX34584.1 DUF3857 and transglutaminase domain-containing protein [Flavobacterium sediminilitoris]
MKFNTLILILILGLFTSNLFSQKYELGKVTIEELKESRHPIDSSASAAILFKKGETKFELNNDGEWTVITEVQFKFKIYKKEGFDYANQQVYYYIGGYRDETVHFKDAITYNLVEGKVQKTKLKSDGEFKEEVNTNFSVRKIAMPQVREGSIIEYSYTLRSPHISSINDWYFQKEIPIDYVEYNVYIPEYFRYRTVISGYENIDIRNENIVTGNFEQQKYIYKIKNVPAIKKENFIININNYTSILKYELASISIPNRANKNVAVGWDDVVKNIYDSENFGDELKSKSYFEEDLKEIVNNASNEKEKIVIIYNYVQNRISWNGKHGVYTDDGVRRAYKQKTGNVAEINLILVAMLKEAGIEVNPVLLSTRDNGIALFPNRFAFNYVVAGVEVLNDVILLDATNRSTPIGLLPLKAVNWKGRIMRERGSSNEINLLNVPFSNDNVIVLAEINEEGEINGKLRRQLTNYNSFLHRENYGSVSQDSYIEKLENKYKGISIKEYKVDNLKHLEKDVIETYSFTENNVVEIIGDKMYISPLLFFTLKENPFKTDERKYPVDFLFPMKDTYKISLKVPEGYQVEYIPTASNLIMENEYGFFRYNISSVGANIQLVVSLDINAFYIPSNAYPALKNFFKMMVEKQAEKVILKKK